jgi:hypothetical protein
MAATAPPFSPIEIEPPDEGSDLPATDELPVQHRISIEWLADLDEIETTKKAMQLMESAKAKGFRLIGVSVTDEVLSLIDSHIASLGDD